MLRLNVISYGSHSSDYDSRLIKAGPEYVIDNPPHGLYGEMHGYEMPSLLQDVAGFRGMGIKVIGYLTGGYEGWRSGGGLSEQWYSLDSNKKLIKNMAEIDRVDGVFIDECSAYPGPKARRYLKELTDLAHGYGLITWGNIGEARFDAWYFKEGGFDLLHTSENWHGQKLSREQREWGGRVSVSSYMPWYTAREAFALTADAWGKGLAYCYISNGYTRLAPWFEEYARLLRDYDG